MRIKLNVLERYVLISILPEIGNFETLTSIEKLKELLYPSEKEVKELGIKVDGSSIRWNDKGKEGKEFEISDYQKDLLMSFFKKLSDKNELTIQQFSVYKILKGNES